MSNINITSADFTNLLKNEGLILVDFAAKWCPPCKMMAPIIENFAKDESLKGMRIVSVDVDEESNLAGKFNVSSIPTFILLQSEGNGQYTEVKKWVGGQEPLTFKSALQGYLNA